MRSRSKRSWAPASDSIGGRRDARDLLFDGTDPGRRQEQKSRRSLALTAPPLAAPSSRPLLPLRAQFPKPGDTDTTQSSRGRAKGGRGHLWQPFVAWRPSVKDMTQPNHHYIYCMMFMEARCRCCRWRPAGGRCRPKRSCPGLKRMTHADQGRSGWRSLIRRIFGGAVAAVMESGKWCHRAAAQFGVAPSHPAARGSFLCTTWTNPPAGSAATSIPKGVQFLVPQRVQFRMSFDTSGWSRRRADAAVCGLGRLNWADSAPTRVALGRTEVRATAAIQVRARNGLHHLGEVRSSCGGRDPTSS